MTNFGVWLGQTEDFDLFQQDLNSYCQLKWTSDGPTKNCQLPRPHHNHQ
jgi:hypothetical protein